jgi:hypothetical protein
VSEYERGVLFAAGSLLPAERVSSYHRGMADTAPLNERLEEIGAQLDWVREYL